ncbi:MAG: Glycosidase PH1107-related protein [Parcubacteria bacterium C7867-001]|nr:MAG: Glycosidase PH1107-related protein [Parcubacteria bacterium C7867-001]
MLELLALLAALLFALGTTGLMLYAFWKLARWIEFHERLIAFTRSLGLSREEANPILKATTYDWEQNAVMNPGVVEADGKVHLFYRAIGADGVSRIGYASSKDGVHFDERLPYPVFAHQNVQPYDPKNAKYDPGLYGSGGSWSGVEDPRAVVIDDRMYLTYNLFNGWDSMRVAITSISLDDLTHKRWRWTKPVFLSPQGERHKNWVLFPGKIQGNFAVLHNLHTGDPSSVRVDYVEDIASFTPSQLKTESPDPNALPDNPISWHKRMRSAGPPPIRTPEGWLVLYHATDHESHRYKLGAALLDLADPRKVIARSSVPALVPDAHYENEGAKSGIVYACGALIQDGFLRVYYGAADTVVCSAKIELGGFLKRLKAPKPIHPVAPALAFT